ncbi:MAG: ABC transporter substrate-binding protein [Dehalococcoidia bacterium]
MGGYWDRFSAARIGRRRFLSRAAAAGGSAALLLAGCSGSSSTSTVSDVEGRTASPSEPDVLNPAGPPRRGGRFVTANAASLGTFDPHLGIAVASAYFPRVYNVLVNQSATKPEFLYHDLAESYEIVDELTYVFQLRPGVTIGPNDLDVPERDLDAEDVRVSLERISSTPNAVNYSFASEHIDSVRVDGSAVTVRTTAPYAWFLNRIGQFTNSIAPRELLTGNLDRLAAQAAGAGPFRLTDARESESAKFDRNPNYYRTDPENNGAQLPYVDGLDVLVIFDRATQRTAFETDQVHLLMTGSGEEARALSDAVIARDPFFAYVSFTMNPTRPPFTDPRVRRAISLAIDRQRFVDVVYGGDAQADGLVQWSLGAYALPPDELARLQPYDPEEAKRIVKEVGGIRIKMMYPANTPILEHSSHLPIFIEQLRAADIDVDEDPLEFTTWIDDYLNMRYDCSLALNQTYETPELPLAFHLEGGPFGDQKYVRGLGDPDIEAAVAKVSRTLGFEERVEAVHEAQRVIYEKAPMMLPLVTPYNHLAYRPQVKNIPAGIGTSGYFINTFWMDV